MTTKPTGGKNAKKQLHESLTGKINAALADVTHTLNEIKLKKLVKKTAKVLVDALHKNQKAKKKSAKVTQVKVAKKATGKPAGKTEAIAPKKKSIKKAASKK